MSTENKSVKWLLYVSLCLLAVSACDSSKRNRTTALDANLKQVEMGPAPIEIIVEAPGTAADLAPTFGGPITPIAGGLDEPIDTAFLPPPFLPPPPLALLDGGDDDHSGDDDHESPPLVDLEVDVLADVSGSLEAFGDIAGPQGMLRDIEWVTLDGSTVPVPAGPLPLARGYEYFIAGFIYPSGTLDSCAANPSQPCTPNDSLIIGRWICQGQAINDANLTSTGDPMVLSYQLFEFTKTKQKGLISAVGTEGNNFTDTTSTFTLALTGGSGKYFGASGEIKHRSLGPAGDFMMGTATVMLREKLRFSTIQAD